MPRPRRLSGRALADAAPVFAALGDETRLALVARLCADGPQPIVSLTEGAGISRQAVTKHLEALADAGLVQSAREGRRRIWTVRTERLAEAQAYLQRISRHWDEALERLRRHVE